MAGVRSSWWALFVGILAVGCGQTKKNGEPAPDEPNGVGGVAGVGGAATEPADAPNCAITLASDDARYCAAYEDGSVWCWGNEPEPARVELPGRVNQLYLGAGNVCAAVSGTLYCWGDNAQRQLSDEPGPVSAPIALELGTNFPVQSLGIDAQQLCAVDLLMHVYCRGGGLASPTQIEVGNNTILSIPGPGTTVVDGSGQVFSLQDPLQPELIAALGKDNAIYDIGFNAPTCVLRRSGSLWCSGYMLDQPSPLRAKVALGESVASVAVSDLRVCALDKTGRVWCEGWNRLGQAGQGTTVDFVEGDYISAFDDAVELAVTRASGCALRQGGSVWCWGIYAAADQPTIAPHEVTGCDRQRTKLSLPSAPTPQSSQRVAQAGEARAQAVCECGSGEPADSCLLAENTAPNATCVEALAPTHEAWPCLAEHLWLEAQCYEASGECASGSAPGSCSPPVTCTADTTWLAVSNYCRRQRCPGATNLLGQHRLCDGTADCEDGSDELNCTPAQAWFDCGDEQRVPIPSLCNGLIDCGTGADENGCN